MSDVDLYGLALSGQDVETRIKMKKINVPGKLLIDKARISNKL